MLEKAMPDHAREEIEQLRSVLAAKEQEIATIRMLAAEYGWTYTGPIADWLRQRLASYTALRQERSHQEVERLTGENVRQRAVLAALTTELAEYEGVDGRCPIGHNKKFTYSLQGQIGCVACERDAAKAEVAALTTARDEAMGQVERLQGVIRWALGEVGEFPEQPEASQNAARLYGRPRFWWRSELRKRVGAALSVSQEPEKKTTS
jgi:hypothetical protein